MARTYVVERLDTLSDLERDMGQTARTTLVPVVEKLNGPLIVTCRIAWPLSNGEYGFLSYDIVVLVYQYAQG